MLDVIKLAFLADDKTGPTFKSVEKGLKQLETASRAANQALGLIGMGVGVGAMVAFASRAMESADNIAAMTHQLGIGAEALTAYKYVAEQSGTNLEAFARALKFANKSFSEAANGSKELEGRFKDLHLNLQQLLGMSPEQRFEAIGAAIAKMPDAADRTAYSMALLGKTGNEVIPAFEGGADAVKKLREEAEQLGLVLTQDQVDAADAACDSANRMKAAWGALGQEMVIANAGWMEKTLNWFTKIGSGVNSDLAWIATVKEVAKLPQEVNDEFARVWAEQGRDAATAYWKSVKANWEVWAPGVAQYSLGPPINPPKVDTNKLKENLTEADRIVKAFYANYETDPLMNARQDPFLNNLLSLEVDPETIAREEQQKQDQLEATNKKLREQDAAAANARSELERLAHEATLGFQVANNAANMFADSLANNLAAAINGAKVKLIDLESIAESVLSMVFRYAIMAGLHAIGVPSEVLGIAGAASSGHRTGSGFGGLTTDSVIPAPAGSTTIYQLNNHFSGAILPDKMALDRIGRDLHDAVVKAAKSHGPGGRLSLAGN